MTEQTDENGLAPWEYGIDAQERVFVREFLIDMNTMRAGLASGITSTEESAQKNSWRITRRPKVLKAIAAAMEERSTALQINARTVLAEAFRSYMACVAIGKWSDAAKFLDMCGRHVNVGAFRDKARGLMGDGDDDLAEEAMKNLTDEELEQLARLSRKAAGLSPDDESTPPLRH